MNRPARAIRRACFHIQSNSSLFPSRREVPIPDPSNYTEKEAIHLAGITSMRRSTVHLVLVPLLAALALGCGGGSAREEDASDPGRIPQLPPPSTSSPSFTDDSLPPAADSGFSPPFAGTESASAAQCDPNYRPCVPIDTDVDCAGGRGNGPSYVKGPVTVVDRDKYQLDRDGDGIGCEN